MSWRRLGCWLGGRRVSLNSTRQEPDKQSEGGWVGLGRQSIADTCLSGLLGFAMSRVCHRKCIGWIPFAKTSKTTEPDFPIGVSNAPSSAPLGTAPRQRAHRGVRAPHLQPVQHRNRGGASRSLQRDGKQHQTFCPRIPSGVKNWKDSGPCPQTSVRRPQANCADDSFDAQTPSPPLAGPRSHNSKRGTRCPGRHERPMTSADWTPIDTAQSRAAWLTCIMPRDKTNKPPCKAPTSLGLCQPLSDLRKARSFCPAVRRRRPNQKEKMRDEDLRKTQPEWPDGIRAKSGGLTP
jgi:hypothetical protein